MRIYYRVFHLFFTKQADHIHCFDIGIYDSKEKAISTIELMRTKEGFSLRPDKFYICRVFRFCAPKLLNRTYWTEGFRTYTYTKKH